MDLLFCPAARSGTAIHTPLPSQTPMVPRLLTALWAHQQEMAHSVAAHLKTNAISRPGQPLAEAAGRRARSFRYTGLVSSSKLSLRACPCFRSGTLVLPALPRSGLRRRPSTDLILVFLPGSPSQPGDTISRPPLLLPWPAQSLSPRAHRPAASRPVRHLFPLCSLS
jgi:hypothetical protein